MERLGHVVVGPQVQALGLIRRGALRRQQDHRHRPPLAQLTHHLDSVEVRHDDVEQDDVRPDLLGLDQRVLSPVRRHDPESLFAQGDRNELGDAWLVIGHEDQRLRAHSHTSSETATVPHCVKGSSPTGGG